MGACIGTLELADITDCVDALGAGRARVERAELGAARDRLGEAVDDRVRADEGFSPSCLEV